MLLAQSADVWLPTDGSTIAPEIDGLFYFVLWASVVIFVGVVAAMAYFAYKYRRRDTDERSELVEESKLIEISWVIIPTILVLIVFVWGFRTFIKVGVAPPNAYEITVRAQQWSWVFEYPNGAQSSELHVPVDQPVRLKMSSATTDVLHSFFVPAFRVKQDILPNRYTYVWFEPTVVDTFTVFCTEYCGTGHSDMLADVVVQERADFEQWLEDTGSTEDMPLPELGEQLYAQCQACHSLDGSRGIGPSFQGLYGHEVQLSNGETVTANENYLRQSILDPGAQIVQGFQNIMPPSLGASLSEREVTALIAFIEEQSGEEE